MTLKRHPALTPVQMQTLVTKAFPNVTSINVQEALDNATDLIGKLSSGLKISSRLALALGIFVFLLILMFQLLSARPDWRQLLVLGMTAREIWWLQVLAYGGLCLIGTLIGALIMGVLRNGLNLLGVSSFIQQVVIGVVIIAAVLLDTFFKQSKR